MGRTVRSHAGKRTPEMGGRGEEGFDRDGWF